jgi:hypothetical protein
MAQIILVVDIETTGLLDQGGKIVEIGIVKLDLENGKIVPAFDSLIKEPGFDLNHTEEPFGWIFKNSSITYEEVLFSPSLESKRDIIQGLFDEYPATAYNKEFDFGFLKDRGFDINELPCPMLTATPLINLPPNPGYSKPKWPKVEESWEFLFKKSDYNETHRGLNDAINEAKIVFELFRLGHFKIKLNSDFKIYNEPSSSIKYKWGCINDLNEVCIPFKFDHIGGFSEGYAIVTKCDKGIMSKYLDYCDWPDYSKLPGTFKKGVIDNKGELIIPYEFNDIQKFSEGMAAISKDGGGGYIDITGKIIIPSTFKHVCSFSQGIARVIKDINGEHKEGFINKLGEIVIPFEYDRVSEFLDGFAIVQKNEKYGMIEKSGKLVIPLNYKSIYTFNYGLAQVEAENGYFGFVNIHGEEVIPCIYPKVGVVFCEGYVSALNKKYGFIDATGKMVIPFVYDSVSYFSEGLASITKNGKSGYIDKLGQEIIPCIYDNAWAFSDGIACVKKNGKHILIDVIGNRVSSSEYDWIDPFSEGLARVKKNKKYGFINNNGQEIIPINYGNTAFKKQEGLICARL